ncbi:MAG TPA: hypothetical protein VIT41_13165 [Microlunatus sp.]
MAAVITKQVLAGIRLVNGGLALAVPNVVGGRLGVSTVTSPGLGYAFRLFGVRTVLIGIQLWRTPAVAGNHVIRETMLIHGADTAAALVVYKMGELPRKGAMLAVGISAVNTALAVLLNWQVRRAAP